MDLKSRAEQARELSNSLFRDDEDGMACTGSVPNASCISLEYERPLTRAEKAKGWAKRPFFAFDENKLCNACCAYWHAERAAQLLHEMHCWQRKTEAQAAVHS